MESIYTEPIQILDTSIALKKYAEIDFSIKNPALNKIKVSNHNECQNYIDDVLKDKNAQVVYGGYLERRNLYAGNTNFSSSEAGDRNIHLGIDFWSPAGTRVIAPIDGKVHSFRNNAKVGDYGPAIILEHNLNGFEFHTLYGHLSLESLKDIYVGRTFRKGDKLAALGNFDINGGYAPHLHFQIILDMQGKKGDYPGVCSAQNLEFYSKNCPDPNLLLHI